MAPLRSPLVTQAYRPQPSPNTHTVWPHTNAPTLDMSRSTPDPTQTFQPRNTIDSGILVATRKRCAPRVVAGLPSVPRPQYTLGLAPHQCTDAVYQLVHTRSHTDLPAETHDPRWNFSSYTTHAYRSHSDPNTHTRPGPTPTR
jgi:hypothetical protein